jgi:hypothetical protein
MMVENIICCAKLPSVIACGQFSGKEKAKC